MRAQLTAIFVLIFAMPTLAQDSVLVPGFQDCLTDNISTGKPVIECVTAAHARCDDLLGERDRALTCYQSAKDEWGDRLKDLLASFSDRPEDLQEVVRIEAKYAAISNLLNCDLRMELSLVGRDPDPSDDIVRAQCEAVAAAASLTEVLFKSGTITRN